MKFGIKRIWQLILVIAFPVIIYNTKTDYYKKKVDFYESDLNGVVTQIKQTRGTKVYLNESEYFYLEQLQDKSLKVGDSINKKGSELNVFEKNNKDEYNYKNKITVIKPESSYFKFFFGL
tara:strand:- start:62 stop:421 length:360 start_codon:yes stop_codon:yes gene_type:complete